MKTGLLKWKPDYEGASVEYGKAGKFNVELQCFVLFNIWHVLICVIFLLCTFYSSPINHMMDLVVVENIYAIKSFN